MNADSLLRTLAVDGAALGGEGHAVVVRHGVTRGARVAADAQLVVGRLRLDQKLAVLGPATVALEVGEVEADLVVGLAGERVDVLEAEPELPREVAEARDVGVPVAEEVDLLREVVAPLDHGPAAAVGDHVAEDAHVPLGAAVVGRHDVDTAREVVIVLKVQAVPADEGLGHGVDWHWSGGQGNAQGKKDLGSMTHGLCREQTPWTSDSGHDDREMQSGQLLTMSRCMTNPKNSYQVHLIG